MSRTVANSSFCSVGVVAQWFVMELLFLEVGLVVSFVFEGRFDTFL